MDDLIRRQQAIDALNHELRCGAVINQCGLEMAYEVIEGLPSAQPKRGKWQCNGKHGTFKIYTCDKCGWNYEAKHNYCPNCGVKMEVTE